MNLSIRDLIAILGVCIVGTLIAMMIIGTLYADCVKDGLDFVQCWYR